MYTYICIWGATHLVVRVEAELGRRNQAQHHRFQSSALNERCECSAFRIAGLELLVVGAERCRDESEEREEELDRLGSEGDCLLLGEAVWVKGGGVTRMRKRTPRSACRETNTTLLLDQIVSVRKCTQSCAFGSNAETLIIHEFNCYPERSLLVTLE